MIPNDFLDFDPRTHPHLGTPFWGAGVMGGSKLLCVLWPLCVYLDPGLEELFCRIWTRDPWRGSHVSTPSTPHRPLPYAP